MSERPSLGWSAISKLETPRSGWEKLSRLVFLVIGIVVMAVVFLWLTDSAQKSTAHATGPDGVHYDPNSQ
jgi:divalent metal cation (Fe/Co/Zn/Cd) transporter